MSVFILLCIRADSLLGAVTPKVVAFWSKVAQCETGSKWDWGARNRPSEGKRYEGGVGFYYMTWQVWAKELHLYTKYQHAYLAPKLVQIEVAQYGLVVHRGYWGCLH